ncbi:FAD:protein FMN transferase, partial [Candidatus Kaiserbacteria bacterium]|nr:FAD:protein FMN transferase [Candidatus Kaiserbacteria bacterium]
FDPLVLPELQRSGYLESLVNTEKAAPDYRDRKAAAFSAVECGHGSVTLPPHSALDLGGIGKGYAADALGQLLSDSWLHLCLSLGGDIYVSGSEDEEPWILDVESLNGETITYQGTDAPYGIATSGLIRRGSTPHLIDPRTRELAYAEYKLATVVAPTTTAADVLASCILIAGPAEAERLIKSGTITAALLQKRGGAPLLLGSGNGNASGFTIS